MLHIRTQCLKRMQLAFKQGKVTVRTDNSTHVSPRGIFDGHSDTIVRQYFLRVLRLSLVRITPPWLHTRIQSRDEQQACLWPQFRDSLTPSTRTTSTNYKHRLVVARSVCSYIKLTFSTRCLLSSWWWRHPENSHFHQLLGPWYKDAENNVTSLVFDIVLWPCT
jgi:hypothetical protein